MAEVVGVARSGHGEVPGPGRTNGRGTFDGRVGGRSVRVKNGLGNSGRAVAVEPGELAACVEDHGDVLWRRAH